MGIRNLINLVSRADIPLSGDNKTIIALRNLLSVCSNYNISTLTLPILLLPSIPRHALPDDVPVFELTSA